MRANLGGSGGGVGCFLGPRLKLGVDERVPRVHRLPAVHAVLRPHVLERHAARLALSACERARVVGCSLQGKGVSYIKKITIVHYNREGAEAVRRLR